MNQKRTKLSLVLIAGASFGFLCFIIVSAILISNQYKTLNYANKIYTKPFLILDSARDIRYFTRHIYDNIKKCTEDGCNKEDFIKIKKYEDDIDDRLEKLEALSVDNKQDIATLKTSVATHKQYIKNAIEYLSKNNKKGAKEYLQDSGYSSFYVKFSNDVEKCLVYARNSANEMLEKAEQDANIAFAGTIIFVVIVFVFGVFITSQILGYIKLEFSKLHNFIEDAKNEKYKQIEISNSDSKEFVDLKVALNTMLESMQNASLKKEYAIKEMQLQALDLFKQKFELEEAELRYHTIFENSFVGIALIDPDSMRFLEFNKAVYEMLDLTNKDLFAYKISDLELSDNPQFTQENIASIVDGGFGELETTFKKSNNGLCDVRIIANTIDLHGKTYLQITIRDVTLHKQLYQEILDEKNSFKEFFNSSPIALALIDNNARILEINPTFYNTFGYSNSDAGTLNDLVVLALDDSDYRAYVVNSCKIALSEHEPEGNKFVTPVFNIRCKDGTQKYIKISATQINEKYIAAFLDLTESVNYETSLKILNEKLMNRAEEETKKRVASEKTLIQSEKMAQLGNMIGVILHQWKQPLFSISIFAQELKLNSKSSNLSNELVLLNSEQILNQVDFMAKTADEFKDFYKPSKERKNFTVMNQIKIVEAILSKQLTLNNIVLEIQGLEDIEISGFESEFKQVVLNIITNSRDAFANSFIINPTIKIDVFKEGTFACISIEDNAGGISEELLPDKLFESFVSTKGNDGTGVGLSLCKTIIKEHFNGDIFAKNIENGANFTIKIPMLGC